MRYMVVIEKGATSYGAFVPDLPGCIAAGKTEADALELIHEAVQLHLEELRLCGNPIPEPASKCMFVEIGLAA